MVSAIIGTSSSLYSFPVFVSVHLNSIIVFMLSGSSYSSFLL